MRRNAIGGADPPPHRCRPSSPAGTSYAASSLDVGRAGLAVVEQRDLLQQPHPDVVRPVRVEVGGRLGDRAEEGRVLMNRPSWPSTSARPRPTPSAFSGTRTVVPAVGVRLDVVGGDGPLLRHREGELRHRGERPLLVVAAQAAVGDQDDHDGGQADAPGELGPGQSAVSSPMPRNLPSRRSRAARSCARRRRQRARSRHGVELERQEGQHHHQVRPERDRDGRVDRDVEEVPRARPAAAATAR